MVDVKRDWESVYEQEETPWDAGKPESVLARLIKEKYIRPCKTLELGCGNGNDAIFLAKNGFDVTAVDISKKAIENAKERGKNSNVKVKFLAEDVTDLKSLKDRFKFLYDRACFHFIPEEKRELYLNNVKHLLVKNGDFVLIASSDKETVPGPYQFSKNNIEIFLEILSKLLKSNSLH